MKFGKYEKVLIAILAILVLIVGIAVGCVISIHGIDGIALRQQINLQNEMNYTLQGTKLENVIEIKGDTFKGLKSESKSKFKSRYTKTDFDKDENRLKEVEKYINESSMNVDEIINKYNNEKKFNDTYKNKIKNYKKCVNYKLKI